MKLPQLSLRELFWLLALVAMGCGWWVDRFRIREQQRLLDKATIQAKHEHELLIEGAKTQRQVLLYEREAWARVKSKLDPATLLIVEAAEQDDRSSLDAPLVGS